MSFYEGVTSVNHAFMKTTVRELLNCVDNDGNGIFVLGTGWCPHCKAYIPILNKLAMDKGLTVYYINGDELSSDDKKNFEEYFYDYLVEDENGEREIQIPHVMGIGDGEVVFSEVSANSEKDAESLYKQLLSMFKQ